MKEIVVHVMKTLYQYVFVSIILSLLIVFFFERAKRVGIKKIIIGYWKRLKNSKKCRKELLFCFVISMILFRTVFCRAFWGDPLHNIYGYWRLHFSTGSLNTENIENTLLFVPFSFMCASVIKDKRKCSFPICIGLSICISCAFSMCIEVCQLFLKVGTLQLSDIVFNTLGGVIGCFIYIVYSFFMYIICTLKNSQKLHRNAASE